ncbi:glycosyltransferase family 39 protein [Modicisalibacter radicis]|uniref:glycosyltransferase family 39 protein n=1 Tax=Halomonas sp. EAR18 TaxID=2518972 RepID=UPI00109D779D|nr:glycosyltransferase family 39 protein [Halomonas sp. EAR18]
MAEQHSKTPFNVWLGYLVAALLGMACFWIVCGSPANVLAGGLMIDTDYPNAAAAFEIFVRGQWHWPLGENPNFGGVNIFFSDGAPWLALLAKVVNDLTGFYIPFHVLTIINSVLFALMAYRLARLLVDEEVTRWLICALLVFSLIMPVRMIGAQHIALSSYWVVLWAMCSVPVGTENRSSWWRWEFIAATGLAILSHAYLGAMSIAIVGVVLLSERRWLAAPLAVLWPLALLYVVGVFHGEHATTEGAKAYSLDLLAFAESLGWAIVPNLYAIDEPPQSDAILYLGTGTWLLLLASAVVSAGMFARKPAWPNRYLSGWLNASIKGHDIRKRRLVFLLIAALLLVIYAMAFDLRIAGQRLLSLDIPSLTLPLYDRFRVTGRFAAPMAFLLIVLACMAWSAWRTKVPKWGWAGVACLAIVMQFLDAQHAGTKSPPGDWLADAEKQRDAVASVLEGRIWSGKVYKDVGYFELEQQRLIDSLLVDFGARHFEVVHGARLAPHDVERRSGYRDAKADDVVLLNQGASTPECSRQVIIKAFVLCLVK